MSDRFDELVCDVSDPAERERLRRVHELLLSVDPPPELSPALATTPTPRPEPLQPPEPMPRPPTPPRYTPTATAS